MKNVLSNFTSVIVLIYAWLQIIFLGGFIIENILLYPNVFHDVPHSVEVTSEFLQVTSPGTYFPIIGMSVIGAGIVTLIFTWKLKNIRGWILGSLIVFILGNFIFSVIYAWPRNIILFEEGAAVHSTVYLQQVANEFITGNWVRVVTSVTTAILAFIGWMRFYRYKMTIGERSTEK
ncbi:DUF1772 domain-containing protein [Aureibacillus halotolerans]|uniref:DUF1772 domain-containing protein n=1 Tax=Aureibacillus halotolerans TaxID=1508390 RepID=A0A4R6U647_9BACI|nr:DUF1772 domain-containing protein [Aureibacillus halotolerans]TDQ41052.1 hypothetical protein EV213_10449 [Aureibacillus halotolerans]